MEREVLGNLIYSASMENFCSLLSSVGSPGPKKEAGWRMTGGKGERAVHTASHVEETCDTQPGLSEGGGCECVPPGGSDGTTRC